MKNRLIRLLVTLPLLLTASATIATEDAPKPYPLDTCVVSGEKLGEMGEPYVFTKDGQEVKLCCKSCLKKFDKDPDKYLKKLEKAEKTQPATGHEGPGH